MPIIIEETKLKKIQDFTIDDNVLRGPEISIDLISLNIGEVLLHTFDKNPDHVSQIDTVTNRKTTFTEMKDRAVRCALWIEKQGLGCDDIVSLCTPSHLDAYIPVIAMYLTQAIINPWLHNLTLDVAQRWLQLFTPKLIFVHPNAVDVLDEALLLEKLDAKIIVFGEHPKHQSLNDIMESQSNIEVENYRPPNRKSPQEVAIILTSSGTTGLPKGVMISAEAILKNALNDRIDLSNKNVLWYAPPGGIMCNSMMLSSILKKATRYISNNPEPREVCRVIAKFKVNYAQMSPTILNSLASFEDMNDYNMDCLEVMRTGGTKLNRVTFKKLKSSCLRDKIYQVYGTTEIGVKRILPKPGYDQKSHNSIGFVTSNLELKIVDRVTKKTLGPNQLGEIIIKTPTVMLGYYKNPDATRKALDAKGWYHTEDVGYYDENGEIFIIDRLVDAFAYCGQEIFTSEIEDILWAHPAVMDLAVVSVTRKSEGQVPVAFVTIRPGEDVTVKDIKELLTTSEKFKTLPLSVHFLDAIPRTFSQKIAKNYLKQLAFTLTDAH